MDKDCEQTPEKFGESLYSCRRCGHVCNELRDPENWMSGWRVDRTGEIVGAEGRRQSGGTTYVGFVPKPQFRHSCSCRDGLPWESDAHTPKHFREISLVERMKDHAKENDGDTHTDLANYGIDDLL